jgi:predicted LPLAT superfamily acyltransferase
MNTFWYRLLTGTTKICGSWLFVIVSRIIAAGFFVFSSRRVESCRFYGILYPERGKIYHNWCTFKQYQNFIIIHFDRFLGAHARPATYNSQGLEKLDRVIGNQGGILLMSHLGNWEMAATLLKQQKNELKLLLYMGIKEKEGLERLQKEDLQKSGVTIIGVEQESSSPFSALEGIRFLQSGGLISMAGDVVWRSDQRKVQVTFLGRKAFLPEAPFIFALVSGAPLFVFFAFRTRTNNYHITLSEPIIVKPESRLDRARAISNAAQQYTSILEESVKKHPFEWYHFERFIH